MQGQDVDLDDDGLIDIRSLDDLNNIRYNLAGTSYKSATDSDGNSFGCPAETGCFGYELMQDLDFDTDGDGSTWFYSRRYDRFTFDSDDDFDDGWHPIGDEEDPFVAVFDGNSRTISNLAIHSDGRYVGLFGAIVEGAAIRNLGLIDNVAMSNEDSDYNPRIFIGGLVGYQYGGSITASYATGGVVGTQRNDYGVGGLVGGQAGGSITASYATGTVRIYRSGDDYIGGLVGWQDGGSITASYATGDADADESGDNNSVGGLVGRQSGGSITASYATGYADGGNGDDYVGGLVGRQDGGSITESYATGYANGYDGGDYVGGLVGWQDGGSITESYATGGAGGGDHGDNVGGLVGRQDGGSITESYATSYATGSASRYGGGDDVGGLVGRQAGGSITASYATGNAYGRDGDRDDVGGLVGWQDGGSITASYATGDADGGDGGDDYVGGLVGRQSGGSITASYATGAAYGGYGDEDVVGGLVGGQDGGSITASYATGRASGFYDGSYVGGLVGWQDGGSITASYATGDAAGGTHVGGLVGLQGGGSLITASYATGDAAGGGGDYDEVGGLVGYQFDGSIVASYATGDAAGGGGDDDQVGGLVGKQRSGSSITASYGFGRVVGGELEGSDGSTKPDGVGTAAQLTEANAGTVWDSAYNNTLSAWDFGTDVQIPALNYADYDGAAAVFDCGPNRGQFPANACGTLLSGQSDAIASGPSAAVGFSETVSLVGSHGSGRATIESWSWQQLEGPEVTLSAANARETSFTAPAISTILAFALTATDGGGHRYTDRISIAVMMKADRDGDGLIEIDNLVMLHNMRHNLAGTSYKTGIASEGNSFGCPDAGGCMGYELTRELDFDAGGSTWSGNGDVGYTLDSADSQADYFPVERGAGGWLPIGDETTPFAAVFDGNGHTLGNLAIRRDQTYIGLFGAIGAGAAIRNLGLIDNLAGYTGSSSDRIFIGGLVGYQLGGLITASYTTGDAAGGDGDDDRVGGLVGYQFDGSIVASYALGAATGGDGGDDYVGGLVGYQAGGSITASYATGSATGGDGGNDVVGGLVGVQFGALIEASYATGAAVGGDGDDDQVGGLVGYQADGSITASYATGVAAGGGGDDDKVGGLVGVQFGASITASYGFGRAVGGELEGSDGSTKPDGVGTAARLTADNAGSAWNDAGGNTLGAWDFGTDAQIPALKYADYDAAGDVFDCVPDRGPNRDYFPANACGTLLPGQRDGGGTDPSPIADQDGDGAGNGGGTGDGGPGDGGPGDGGGTGDGGGGTDPSPMADQDGDGLLEIDSLIMLHNMRHNLEGTSYRTSAASVGNSLGCPVAGCRGYELMQDLDFDVNGDGGTWSEHDDAGGDQGYSLDSADSQADYFPVERGAGGWLPIGDETNPFVAVFDGNSHTISNLAIRRDQTYVGLFGSTGSDAAILNLGLIDNLADYTGSSGGGIYIGGLVGLQGGSITASYVTGVAAGGDGDLDYVGGLVGGQSGGSSIAASHATGAAAGGDGDFDYVGGLVGWQLGAITASWATGAAAGGDGGSDYVGGLVGIQWNGSITASYATGAAAGGDGYADVVGGLVGIQDGGAITASYATGVAAGGDGGNDVVGGLVGDQGGGSSITASYATGAAVGGDGDFDYVGGLVGLQFSTITASYATGDAVGGGGNNDAVGELVGRRISGGLIDVYGFGRAIGGEIKGLDGSIKPQGVSTAAQLTEANAGSAWNSAGSNTLDAWDFGAESQIPALNYADYDGANAVFDCDPNSGPNSIRLPADACGALLPGQDNLIASGPSAAVEPGGTVRLAGSLEFGRVLIESWSWRQLAGPEVALSDANASETGFTAPTIRDPFVFKLTATDSDGRRHTDRISFTVTVAADLDGDGLIEIYSLTDLHNMRHNLAGTSYKASAASVGDGSGCPAKGCVGYELMQGLDFDVDGGTWLENNDGGGDGEYSLDPADSQADYFPVDSNGAGGWLPIGDGANPFVAVFDGKGHTLSNLAIRRDQTYVGLFGAIGKGAVIRNLGLIDNLADYIGSNNFVIYVGGLVGGQGGGSLITASYATGVAAGGDGDNDAVGGLVGYQEVDGSVTASHATGVAAGGDGDDDAVGGLVGYQEAGGSITASYATGVAAGGDGDNGVVGGLVGFQLGSITASYAAGAAAGGDGDLDYVGGLVGYQGGGSITASYAMGVAAGGDGDNDVVGRLVGWQGGGSIKASYGFGRAAGGEIEGLDGSTKPQGVGAAAQLTAANAGPAWNDAGGNTLDAWDFGTDEQVPVLNYADYDGAGAVFDCGPNSRHFPANACGTLLPDHVEASASGPSAVGFGETVNLAGSLIFGRVPIKSWSWRQVEGPKVALSDANAREMTFTAPAVSTLLVFELTATDSGGYQYADRITLAVTTGGTGSGNSGGADPEDGVGSMGPRAPVALVLPLLLGWWRRRRLIGGSAGVGNEKRSSKPDPIPAQS